MSGIYKTFKPDRGGFAIPHMSVLMAVVVILTASFCFAQTPTGKIHGTVVEKDTDLGLPGTNLVVLGTRFGTATDLHGNFTIDKVPPGMYKLQCAFIGFKTQVKELTVVVDQEVTVHFQLQPDILKMDAIVVTGTGTAMKKKELTTQVQTITAKEIESSPAENIQQLLSGKISGGQVRSVAGQPGQGKSIRLRGITSFQASQTPVIYIDGVRVENRSGLGLTLGSVGSSALADIHIDNIDRVEVIKGGAASTLYGSEAAAGVIQIFTKSGKAGAPKWRLNISQGWDKQSTRYINYIDPDDLVKDFVYKTGYYQAYSIGVNGGSDRVLYDVGLSMEDNSGSIVKTGANFYALNSNVRAFPTDKLELNIHTRVSRDRDLRTYNNSGFRSANVAITLGDPPFKPESFNPEFTRQRKIDEVRKYQLPDAQDVTYRFITGLTAKYDLNQYFSNSLTLGLDYRKAEQRAFEPVAFQQIRSSARGELRREDLEFTTFTFDYRGTVKYPQEGNLTSAFTFGVQGFRTNARRVYTQGTNFALPGTRDFDNTGLIIANEDNTEIFNGGLFINEQLGLWDKIFVNLGYRIDGNTAFGRKGKKTGMATAGYPKAAIAYTISDESFWENLPFGVANKINTLKLHAAYGETGTFPEVYARDRTFAQGSFRGRPAAFFGNPGNPDIKPERTATTEFGADIELFNGRIGLEMGYYLEKTTDALLFVPDDPSSGLGLSQRNIGEIENKGWEFMGNFNIWNSRSFRIDLHGGYSTINNKVVSLGGVPGFEMALFNRIEEGYPIGILEVFTPEPRTSGEPVEGVDPRFTGDFINTYLQPFADNIYNLGLRLTVGRNLSFHIYGDGQWGGHTISLGRWFRSTAEGAVMVPFLEGDHMVFNGGLVPEGYDDISSFISWIEKSDYFKVREFTATYRLPKRIYGMDISVNLSARNFWNLYVPNQTINPELDADGIGFQVGRFRDEGGENLSSNSSNQAAFSPPMQFRFGLTFGF